MVILSLCDIVREWRISSRIPEAIAWASATLTEPWQHERSPGFTTKTNNTHTYSLTPPYTLYSGSTSTMTFVGMSQITDVLKLQRESTENKYRNELNPLSLAFFPIFLFFFLLNFSSSKTPAKNATNLYSQDFIYSFYK